MPATELEIDCGWTVDEIIRRHPAAMAVFNRFGIDTCCGAMMTVEEVVGSKRDAVCSELQAVARTQ